MSQLPIDEAVGRLQQNEERLDLFVNSTGNYTASDGSLVETLRSFINRINFKLRGAYTSGVVYALNDVVTYSGLAYLCISPYTANATTPNNNLTNWALWPGATLSSLAAGNGATLTGYTPGYAGGVFQSVSQALDKMPTIDSIIPTGTTDHSPYFQTAIASGKFFRVGPGPYNFPASAQINGISGAKMFFEGTVINHPTTNKSTFSFINKDDWALLGNLTINGAGKASGTAIGIDRQGGRGILVENVNCKNISGWGFFENNATFVAPRGDRAIWVNCTAENCFIGREDIAAEDTEYSHWTNFNASGCGTGNITAAGNNRFAGGNIVDNDNGVWLKGAAVGNNNHGGFVGVNINHNTGFNIRMTDVKNGESFTGCHCYGDSTTAGIIWMERCKGINWTGGILDASIRCDDAIGYSFFNDAYCPDSGNANSHVGTTPKKVIYRNIGCPTGMWRFNDPGTVYVRTRRSETAQNIPSGAGTTILFDTTAYDTRDAYDEATGVFATPWLGNYRISGCVKLDGTTVNPDPNTQNSYLGIYADGQALLFAPFVKFSVGGALCSFCVDLGATAGTLITIRVVGFGTNLSINGATSSISFAEVS